jgi:hypothetical protein
LIDYFLCLIDYFSCLIGCFDFLLIIKKNEGIGLWVCTPAPAVMGAVGPMVYVGQREVVTRG